MISGNARHFYFSLTTVHNDIPKLFIVKVESLPANITSKLKPLDLEIIKNFKVHCLAEVASTLLNSLRKETYINSTFLITSIFLKDLEKYQPLIFTTIFILDLM